MSSRNDIIKEGRYRKALRESQLTLISQGEGERVRGEKMITIAINGILNMSKNGEHTLPAHQHH